MEGGREGGEMEKEEGRRRRRRGRRKRTRRMKRTKEGGRKRGGNLGGGRETRNWGEKGRFSFAPSWGYYYRDLVPSAAKKKRQRKDAVATNLAHWLHLKREARRKNKICGRSKRRRGERIVSERKVLL
jgi:hypothetical protein